ncbi:MAG TPA: translocation/assembly module TamB domain-containing protein [Gemmatimonadales bacterium]|nr:translocation/assembly module TamB domain-containing protein [Gemmatimonadales bacterium]
MRRGVARFLFVILLGSLAMVLGVVSSMTLTPPGRNLLARTVTEGLGRIVLGRVKVGAISGSFLYDLTLENLVVRDTSGALLADLPRVRVTYRLPNFLAKQVVLSGVQLERPTIQLIKHRNGRLNLEEVLRLGTGKKGGTSPLIDFYHVRVTDGALRIALPWNPDKSLRTQQARDSALAAERAKPGRVIEQSPEGLRKVILFSDLTTRMARLRISTPDHLPFSIDLDSLATRVSDPAVTVRDAVGRIRLHADSAIFGFSRAALPGTEVSGGGAVTWPHDTILFDFQATASRVSLMDLLWVSPHFPPMIGTGVLSAKSETGARTAYDIRDLHLRGGDQRVDGDLVAITDKRRGLGARDMRLTLRQLDLDAVRPYLDTLPFYGTISGSLAGSGFLDAMDLTLDWTYTDAELKERPVSTLAGDGIVGATRDSGLTFTDFHLRRSNIDLHTVRRLAPAVILEGRLAAAGTLDGPLRNVTFVGTSRQQDAARPASQATGTVHLDTRFDTLGLATDVTFEPLSFEGIRRAFPSLRSQGELRGRFQSEGTLSRLQVNTTLTGQIGTVDANGLVTLLPPKWGAERLLLRFSRLDLEALTGRKLPTALAGELRVTGSIDTLRAPEGDLELALARSRAREWDLDSFFGRGSVHDSVIRVDTAYAEWKGARASGGGTLGWQSPHAGHMAFSLVADSLIGFDSLLLASTGQKRDTSADARPLTGTAEGAARFAGSLDSLEAATELTVRGLEWQRIRSPEISGSFTWLGGRRPRVTAAVKSDSLTVQKWTFHRLTAQASGFADSVGWTAGSSVGSVSRFDGTGQWFRKDSSQIFRVDTLLAGLAAHRYRLQEPASMSLADSAPSVSPFALVATDGSGSMRVAGRVPGTEAGALSLELLGLDIHDLYGLLQRDTTGVSGEVGLDLQVGGTAKAPTLRGTARVADARFGDFQAPLAEAVLNYQNRRLDANLDLWRTGEDLLQVEAHLPLDLAFRGAEKRQLEGPLSVRAHTDSVDLGLLEALTPAVTQVDGTLAADVQVEGSWDAPRLAGSVQVRKGTMTVPGLGVHYNTVRGSAILQGDSLLLNDVLFTTSGGGRLTVGGSVRLENLSRPVLNLAVNAKQFRAIDVRSFLSLTGTGDLQIKGPVFDATLTGRLLANSGVLYFADLINKRIVDLEDPAYADLVDTTLLRQEKLGSKFQNRFLDSLRIDDLRLEMGSDVWLRSAEANIQLEGQVRASKVRQEYQPTGTLAAPRGTYTLKIGPVARDFTVTRGEVNYQGNLNAVLNIQAQHTVRPVRGDEVPVIANISGTLYAPKLTLSSTFRPPISETDLVSYLITGRPANEATLVGQGGLVTTGLAYFSSALSSELERALIQDLGVPIDLIEIRPGISSPTGGATLTQLAAGWQIGKKTFLTFNAGFCPDFSQLSTKNLGAGLEFRFSREWKFQSTVEPTIQSCRPGGLTQPTVNTPYQVGLDILWEREF